MFYLFIYYWFIYRKYIRMKQMKKETKLKKASVHLRRGPTSQLMVELLWINHNSRRHCQCISCSWARIVVSSKFIVCCLSHTCSATAETSVFAYLTAALCSSSQVPKRCPVWPLYVSEHSLQGMLYKTPDTLSGGTGSFTCTNSWRSVMCGWCMTWIFTSAKIRFNVSERPLT